MPRNIVNVRLDDSQIADLKRSIRQSQLKNESEMNKIRKTIEQLQYRVNEILKSMDDMKVEPAIEKEGSDVDA